MMTEYSKKLAADNHKLIYAFLKKYNLSEDEYYGLAAIGLCQAAAGYDGKRNHTFSTYAFTCMKNTVFAELRHNRTEKMIPINQLISFESVIDAEDSNELSYGGLLPAADDTEGETITGVLLENYMKTLTSKKKNIIIAALNGYTQTDIAELFHCSKQYINSVILDLREYVLNPKPKETKKRGRPRKIYTAEHDNVKERKITMPEEKRYMTNALGEEPKEKFKEVTADNHIFLVNKTNDAGDPQIIIPFNDNTRAEITYVTADRKERQYYFDMKTFDDQTNNILKTFQYATQEQLAHGLQLLLQKQKECGIFYTEPMELPKELQETEEEREME